MTSEIEEEDQQVENLENEIQPIVFDAYAWVEYALNGPEADKVKDLLENTKEAFTPASVIAELNESMLKNKVEKRIMSQVIEFIRSRSLVVAIDSEIAELAGKINFDHKKKIKNWGMLDSFVYAVSTSKNAKVLTGDPHFKGLDNVIYLGHW